MSKLRTLESWLHRLGQFRRNQLGNMAAVTAISAIPLMMAGGAAVDFGNWVAVEARLQAAVDSAALAVGREISLSTAEKERLASDYFHANFGSPKNARTPNVTLTLDGNKVRVDASVVVDNYLMKAVGRDSQQISTFAEVSKEATNLDVVLVFDNTGSMAKEQRLSTLKVAANDFVEILFGPRETASTLKVGVVPFSQFVNVGPQCPTRSGSTQMAATSCRNRTSSRPAGTTGWPGNTSPGAAPSTPGLGASKPAKARLR
jgi:Flp pilus assembly protein TadG